MKRAIAGAAIAGAAAVVVGQAVSPFHVATHEFTQLFALLAFPVVLWAGWLGARRAPDEQAARAVLAGAFASVLMTGAGVMIAQLAFNALLHDCRMEGAVAFFWITWVPLGAFAAVVGVVWGERRWSAARVVLGLALLIAVSVVHDVMQGFAGVRVFDPLIGEPLALNQRVTMEVSAIQVYQRAWLLGLAVTIWAVRTSRRLGAVAAVVFVTATLLGGSHLGLGWGTSRLRSALDSSLVTPHFTLRYAAGGDAAVFLTAIARECEWQWHELTRDWGTDVGSIEIRVFDDDARMRELTWAPDAHAVPGRVNVDLQWVFSDTLPHELVHVFQINGTWWRPSRWLRRGFLEGSAQAWGDELVAVREAHRSQAAALEAGHLPDLERVMSILGFWTVNESAAYDAAGSFVGWLVLEHGIERFRALDRRFDFERAYGKSLAELEADWHQFLSRIEVDPDERQRARLRFDPELSPPYVADECPKLGPREVPPEQMAQRHFTRGDYEGALLFYDRLFEEDHEPRWAVRAATCLQQLGRAGAALELLDEAMAGASDQDADQLLTKRIVSLMVLKDWAALDAAIESRQRRAEGTSPEREVVEQCLRDPFVRDKVATALDPRNTSSKVQMLDELAAAHADRRCVAYLAASSRSFGWLARLNEPQRERARAQVRYIEEDPVACALLGHFRHVADAAIREDDLDLAEELSRAVVAACVDPVEKFRAARRLERIAWERADSVAAGLR